MTGETRSRLPDGSKVKGCRALDHQTLTTGQVARLFDVAVRTVSKWSDSGKLRCFRIPPPSDRKAGKGDGDRRYLAEDVVAFAREYGLPLARLAAMAGMSGVLTSSWLLVSQDEVLVADIRATLGERQSLLTVTGSLFDAGSAARLASAVVLDCYLGVSACWQAAESLSRPSQSRKVLMLGSEDGMLSSRDGVDALNRPVSPLAVADWLLGKGG